MLDEVGYTAIRFQLDFIYFYFFNDLIISLSSLLWSYNLNFPFKKTPRKLCMLSITAVFSANESQCLFLHKPKSQLFEMFLPNTS